MLKSDTPSEAGGLMSVPASKADVLAEGYLFSLELPAFIGSLLFADVVTYRC
jgi:hypothetical protein